VNQVKNKFNTVKHAIKMLGVKRVKNQVKNFTTAPARSQLKKAKENAREIREYFSNLHLFGTIARFMNLKRSRSYHRLLKSQSI